MANSTRPFTRLTQYSGMIVNYGFVGYVFDRSLKHCELLTSRTCLFNIVIIALLTGDMTSRESSAGSLRSGTPLKANSSSSLSSACNRKSTRVMYVFNYHSET